MKKYLNDFLNTIFSPDKPREYSIGEMILIFGAIVFCIFMLVVFGA